jgi:hypothetical protein
LSNHACASPANSSVLSFASLFLSAWVIICGATICPRSESAAASAALAAGSATVAAGPTTVAISSATLASAESALLVVARFGLGRCDFPRDFSGALVDRDDARFFIGPEIQHAQLACEHGRRPIAEHVIHLPEIAMPQFLAREIVAIKPADRTTR